jgi:hypothetical protein
MVSWPAPEKRGGLPRQRRTVRRYLVISVALVAVRACLPVNPATALNANAMLHCTAMVTVFDVAPPLWTPLAVTESPKAITTGTAEPLDEPAGTSAFTWYSPTDPGARPEKSTCAWTPPMVAIGVVVVSESWSFSGGEPLGGWLVTAPSW